MRSKCVACLKTIHSGQSRLTLNGVTANAITSHAYVHLVCYEAYWRLREWMETFRTDTDLSPRPPSQHQ